MKTGIHLPRLGLFHVEGMNGGESRSLTTWCSNGRCQSSGSGDRLYELGCTQSGWTLCIRAASGICAEMNGICEMERERREEQKTEVMMESVGTGC